jgi:hypothetical protein
LKVGEREETQLRVHKALAELVAKELRKRGRLVEVVSSPLVIAGRGLFALRASSGDFRIPVNLLRRPPLVGVCRSFCINAGDPLITQKLADVAEFCLFRRGMGTCEGCPCLKLIKAKETT